MGIEALPNSKWIIPTTPEPLVKDDLIDIEAAILWGAGAYPVPTVAWVDNTCVRVFATSDIPAAVMMSGFPSIRHFGQRVGAGLTDGRYRINAANTDMDFDTPSTFIGTEKSSQWYGLYAVAGNTDTEFTLLALPWLRVKTHAYPTINLGTSFAPATGIGYGFPATSTLAGYKLYVVSRSSGSFNEIREITANNTDGGTGGTIDYSGGSLSLAEGDWIALLPPTNFRWLGDFLNNGSGHIQEFARHGNRLYCNVSYTVPSVSGGGMGVRSAAYLVPPLAATAMIWHASSAGTWTWLSAVPYNFPLWAWNYETPIDSPTEIPVVSGQLYLYSSNSPETTLALTQYWTYPDGYLSA